MHVIATAGHVDHGKSTLVRALTGMEPDRWAEERRRGMTIDLGFVWTTLGSSSGPAAGSRETIAFVDVPGHERFVPNMLAGIGPVPAVMLVVAADGGWMPQTQEHVAALDALGVRHALVAVTRADLADPAPVMAAVASRLEETCMRGAMVVPVSAATGAGLNDVRNGLMQLVSQLPRPDIAAPVRLWIDRSFTMRGSGTVVTGTLGAGTLLGDDELDLATDAGSRRVRVRGLQSLGQDTAGVGAVARVAVNLRGISKDDARRGDALLTPGAWASTTEIDGRLAFSAEADPSAALPADPILHIGSAAVSVHARPLRRGTPHDLVRLRLQRPLPLAAGDVALLRDPGRQLILGTITVLDIAPPPLTRRGAAAARAADLSAPASPVDQLRQHGILRASALIRTGAPIPDDAVRAGDWLIDSELAVVWARQLTHLVIKHRQSAHLEPGPTVGQARTSLGDHARLHPPQEVPGPVVIAALAARAQPPLAIRDGRLIDVTAPPPLPAAIVDAVAVLTKDFGDQPFSAPDADRLAALNLGPKQLAAAERAGALLRVAPGVVLLPEADVQAARLLAELPQPFTLSQARQHLGTTRRVAVPLLELLDRRRLTRRLPDDRRVTT